MNTLAPPAGGGLYAITNGPRPDLLDVVSQALAGGARWLQYLDEEPGDARRHGEAMAIQQLCRSRNVPLIIHQDLDLAETVGAAGVHLAYSVDGIRAARARLGPAAIVGAACRDSLENARAAAQAGANYVSFGAMFASPTKPLATIAPIDLLRQSAALGVTRVAIGGITPDNAALLIEAGADYVASISSLFGAADVQHAAQRFAQLFSQSSH
ncbi:MAG: thiamine phosphate synthase [Rhodanobacter sp.]|nr:MAG: thiamine phosphate synthase [Rhodanobacter sp.]TAM01779.1 MAG: thiamine phosphate synthase [Rhodanobacter sp.]TAM40298.1 MAG: thiamine phosphate synthase [Rhodanobacter sp.]TAN23562.1 MAG: thiamine phosphate synthase [Rhodanobacter sp.]